MSCRIVFLPKARDEFLALPPQVRDRLEPRIDALADNPRGPSTAALAAKLKGLRRLRVGDYRVCYRVDSTAQVVTVVEIGP